MTRSALAALGDPSSLGEALALAFERYSRETCAIEADRDRENLRLTYAQMGELSRRFATWLAASFAKADRLAILLTNQARWHVAAAGTFHRGGVLVPIDFKLGAAEHVQLLAHARPRVLVVEEWAWRAFAATPEARRLEIPRVVLVGAPPSTALAAAPGTSLVAWDDVMNAPPATESFVPRARDDVACIVYSSGTGGRPKGCQLTHGNYLAQLASLTSLHPFGPGVRYLSILPTNHAIDFMVGFLGPYLSGATVVHLRTIRPEWVRDAFVRYRITHAALVPVILKNLEVALRARFDALPRTRRLTLRALVAINRGLSGARPRPALARRLLRPVHAAFGGSLRALFVGGARTEPATLRFFHELGIPVANGYGLTEAGTAVTLDRLDPPRLHTVGQPLDGVELRIRDPGADGVGEVEVRGPTVMRGYLDDPALTAETIVDGWLRTGDLGWLDDDRLVLVGRRKNMIVTEGGKNVYPEDVEAALGELSAKEVCIFAAQWLFPARRGDERLLIVARLEPPEVSAFLAEITVKNRGLADWRRVAAVLPWHADFPRTASLKIKRDALAEEIRAAITNPDEALRPLR